MTIYSCVVNLMFRFLKCFFFQAEDGIRDYKVTGVQTCALPIFQAASAADHNQPRPWMILESGQKGLCGGHVDGGIGDRACDRGTEVLRRVAGLVETDEYIETPDGATHRVGVEHVDRPPADVGVSFL